MHRPTISPLDLRPLLDRLEERFLLSLVNVLTIDDFESGAINEHTSPPALTVNHVFTQASIGLTGLPAASVLGGQRKMDLSFTSVLPGQANAKIYITAGDDDLRYNNESDVRSRLILRYGLNPDGTPAPLNADLLAGGADRFLLEVSVDAPDHPMSIRIEVLDADSQTASAAVVANSTTFTTVQLPFAAFAGANLSRIDLIRLEVAADQGVTGLDASISRFATAGEPAVDVTKFVNIASQPPNGGEGLTPGFWKQPQHFHAWTGYSPTDSYESVFGVDVPGSPTLLQALGANGGGVNALLRHSTAALLNAANPNVSYQYGVNDIIAMVQQALAGGDVEGTKNLFEAQNELGADLTTPAPPSSPALPGYGDDANTGPGPSVAVGGLVVFTYVVTNAGAGGLDKVVLVDDNATAAPGDDFSPKPVLAAGGFNAGDIDQDGLLDPGEAWIFEATTTAVDGLQTNLATVRALDANGEEVADDDPASYTGIPLPAVSSSFATARQKPARAMKSFIGKLKGINRR